jgi:transposase
MLKELEAENARLRAENADLRSELALVRGRLDELAQLAALQNEQISDLRSMLRRKTRPQKGASPPSDKEGDTAAVATSERPSGDGTAEASGEAPAPPPPANKPPRKPRSKGTGRRPLPTNVPEVTYEGKVCKCAHCGSKNLLARDREHRARYDAAETIVRLRKELLEVLECKDCGETTTAEPPSLPCPRSKFTCGFLAWLVTMKFVLLVPLHRIWKHLRRQGFEVPKSTLVRLIDLAADLAKSVDGAHWKELKGHPVILTDATGIKVLIPGQPEVWHGILDVFNAGETTVYQFALTKHGDDLARLLKGFEGTILCDAESRLNELARQEGVKRANCNAHPRREFRDAEASQPVLARQAGAFLTRMYAVERRAAAEGLTGPALLARRQAQTRPIVDAFKVWLEAHRHLLPTDPLGKVVQYYLKHFDALTRFVDDANLPIDNNRSERAFQDHGRLRLNSLFAGNPEGARNWALLLGIVTTAQRHDLDVQAYLTWMFERRGTRRREYGLSAADLTPAAYKKMLEEERSRAAAAAAA